MKKILTLSLAAVLLLSSLAACRMPEKHDYFGEAMEQNPDVELPKSEAMEVDPEDIPQFEIIDALSGYEEEMTFDIPVNGEHAAGELVVKYRIYDFAYEDRNVAIVSVENHSTQALTVSIDGRCEDTLQGKTKRITRSFEGFAAGWQNYFIFDPKAEFDEFSYEIDFEYYDGETFGQLYTNLEYGGLTIGPAAFFQPYRVDVEANWYYDYQGKAGAGFDGGVVMFNAYDEVLYCNDNHWDNWCGVFLPKPSDFTSNGRAHIPAFIGTDMDFYWEDLECEPGYGPRAPIDKTNYQPSPDLDIAYGIVAFDAMYGEMPEWIGEIFRAP